MTANATGYSVYQGMSTALETLCGEAVGSKNKLLVGLYFQQMVLLLWLLTIPIGIVWYNAGEILSSIIPHRDTAQLAGDYLRILLWGCPGYAAFEAGKKYLQAQGIFHAATYVLAVVAPLNVLVSWLLVWKLRMGFLGAPIAAALTNNLCPLLLFLYVLFIDGRECWNGVTVKAFRNWGTMIKLALPGFIMLEAEYVAFELLTLGASQLSNTELAAQSIVSPLIALTFQAPASLAVTASTMIATAIGAKSVVRARSLAKVCPGIVSLLPVSVV
jgi:multidrug resistance protein, MATE family